MCEEEKRSQHAHTHVLVVSVHLRCRAAAVKCALFARVIGSDDAWEH
jgi:hypothetical protein